MAGSLEVAWRNEDVDLGSDHSIISITIKGPWFRAALVKAQVTDWDRTRKHADDENDTSEENADDGRRKTYAEWAREQEIALNNGAGALRRRQASPHVGGAALAHAKMEASTSK